MTIIFSNPRKPTSIDALSEVQQQQLALLGTLYDGVTLPVAERLSPERAEDEDIDNGVSFYGMIELWDVHEEGVHRYNAFMVMADSGALFEKDSTELVIERIQAFFGGGGGNRSYDEDFEEALDEAYRVGRRTFSAQLKSTGTGAWGAYEVALHAAQDADVTKAPATKKTSAKAPAKAPAAKKAAAKKPAAKAPAAKKPAAKKPAAKKPVAKKPAAKKAVAKRASSKAVDKPPTVKKVASKKAAKKATAKPAAKKPTAKKPAAKKPTAKKPAAKKPAAKKPAKR